MNTIGPKLKTLRKQRRLTLRQLAIGAGCSPSLVSYIETGKTDPSISTLKKIATVLKVNMVDFFVENDTTEPIVMQESMRIPMSLPVWRAQMFSLTKSVIGKRMQPFFTVIQPRGGAREVYVHDGDEFGIVLKGTLTLRLAQSVFTVRENESFYFSSTIPHSWVNNTKKETIVVWVVSPPTF
jgi:transcriptional regulator with XRE-family HTH domain